MSARLLPFPAGSVAAPKPHRVTEAWVDAKIQILEPPGATPPVRMKIRKLQDALHMKACEIYGIRYGD